MGDSGPDRRAVRDVVVGRWAVSLCRAVLGVDRSSRTARIREETRNPNRSARRRIARLLQHDAAICVVRLAECAQGAAVSSPPTLFISNQRTKGMMHLARRR